MTDVVADSSAFVCDDVRPTYEKNCTKCGNVFQTKRKQTQFCSGRCATFVKAVETTRRSEQKRKRNCGCCGTEFIALHPSGKAMRGQAKWGLYCSRKCAGQAKRKHRPPKPEIVRQCKTCGSECPPSRRVFCCHDCAKPLPKPRSFEKQCKCCQSVFVVSQNKGGPRYCDNDDCRLGRLRARTSLEARRKYRKRRRDKFGRGWRSRCLKLGVPYGRVSVTQVFERDGWSCQICGQATPKHLRGAPADNAPTLDHKVPLSRGGGHTYSNVWCACRRCNCKIKGRKTMDELYNNIKGLGGRKICWLAVN